MLGAEVIFPPSTNWYIPHVLDALPSGTLALATNQAVTVVDGATRRVLGICNSRGRVTGVALSGSYVVACTSERGVHAFDLATLQPVASHKDHHGEPSAIVAVERAGKTIAITGDKRGTLCLWTLPSSSAVGPVPAAPAKALERCCPQREVVVCLAVASSQAPADSEANGQATQRLAVGYVSGTVVVLDIATQATLLTFCHRAQVHNLSWASPSCLASACQDQSVQLWRLPAGSSEGVAEIGEQVAEVLGKFDGPESRLFVSVYAVSEDLVLYSGPRGELFCWEAPKRQVKRAAPIHTRPIFAIRPVGKEHVATAGMDRYVVLWALGKGVPTMKWRLCALGGHVTSIRTDGANIAVVGCGDNSARIVDLMHREHRQHCWVLWRGLRSPMTSLAAGPAAGAWAYGLQDGSFGALPINMTDGPGNVEVLSQRNHPGPVTTLCWLQVATAAALPSFSPTPPATAAVPIEDDDGGKGGATGPRKEGPAEQRGKGGKDKKADAKKGGNAGVSGVAKELAAIPRGSVLVSLSAGHQILATRVAFGGGEDGRTQRPSPVALSLEALSGASPVPVTAATWPLALSPPSHGGGDALVVAAAHRPGGESLAMTSLQFFQLFADGAGDGEDLRLTPLSVLPVDGLDGGVTAMALSATPPSEGATRCCEVLFGTAKGGIAVISVQWPASAVPQAPGAYGGTVDCLVRQAHSKAVTDVQWRDGGGFGGGGAARDDGLFLTSSADGWVKIWRHESSRELLCLHSLSGQSPQSAIGGAMMSACWDVSSGAQGNDGILCGGRDQIALRWTPGAECHASGAVESSGPGGPAGARSGLKPLDASGPLPLPAPPPMVERPKAPSVNSSARTAKQRTKQTASFLPLASASLYQQSAKGRALELARLAPGALTRWPGAEPLGATAKVGDPPTMAAAIFTNRQDYADWWLEMELMNKLQGYAEERVTALQRARLLKLWATDVKEAMALELGEDAGAGADLGLPMSWLWAALSPAASGRSWESALENLSMEDTSRGQDAVHFAAAAALALGRDDEAVKIYVRAELLADATLLARLRFPSRHPLVSHVYELWAADFRRRGRCDQAAACHLAVGQFGSALADLEDSLASARPSRLCPDHVFLAGAFVAACVAEAVASAHLKTVPSSPLREYDLSLAFDHRQWWGVPELRASVRCWRRCFVEALRAGRSRQALALARVEFEGDRSLTEGESFLRATMAGYASAVGWWLQLDARGDDAALGDGTTAAEGSASEAPLQEFVALGQAAIAPEEDWGFEWRVITWLPAFDASEDALLTAAVELGRACSSLASGSTRAASGGDAPWDHVVNAVNAILSTGEVADTTFAKALVRLGQLALRPDGSVETRVRGQCVSASAAVAAGVDCGTKPWEYLSGVLFGLPASLPAAANDPWTADDPWRNGATGAARQQPAASSSTGDAVRARALRRGYRLARATCSAVPSPAVTVLVAAETASRCRHLSAAQDAALCRDLEAAMQRAIVSCGLLAEVAPAATADDDAPRVLEQARRAHTAAPALVPLAATCWCARLASLLPESAREAATDEYEATAAGDVSADEPRIARELRALGEFIAEVLPEEAAGATPTADGAANDEEAQAVRGVLRLESVERLAWAARLELLRGRLAKVDASVASDATAVAQARGVCELLAAYSAARPSAAPPVATREEQPLAEGSEDEALAAPPARKQRTC